MNTTVEGEPFFGPVEVGQERQAWQQASDALGALEQRFRELQPLRFSSRETAIVCTKLQEARLWLQEARQGAW